MKKIFLYLTLILLISCEKKSNDNLQLTEGISAELATYRKQQVSDVLYNLTFNIPLIKEDSISSKLSLEVSINDLSQPLFLDFKPNKKFPIAIFANGKEISTKHEKEHIIIPSENLVLGENAIEIEFIAGEMSLNRNDNYLYTLLVPDRARTLFPCFDQPDIKASYVLNITSPKDWKVLCGSSLDFEKEKEGFIERQFKETDKMSTYLFSFVAGKFKVANSTDSTFNMQMLYRETDEDKINKSVNEIFDLHQQSVDFLEDYTNYNFPFQKLDFATIYSHPYGGMEHTGAIQYRQSSLFLDSSATQSKELSRAKLIAHETSHMWFGNLVTMKWFDDVWLKEVFANFMADKIVNPAFPNFDHDLQFMTAHYPSAYSIDRSKGANPIRQKLDNLNNAGSLYGGIIYHKAPIMMRQLEVILGVDKFQQGIMEYIKEYANNNADWNDLIRILDKKTTLDLKQWSNVWVNSSGRPIINSKVSYDSNNLIKSFEIEQIAEDGSDKMWSQLFDITLVYPDSSQVFTINLSKKNISIPTAVGLSKPDFIIYNSNGLGYGVFPIDINKLEYIPNIKNVVARASSYINCYENFLNGTLSVSQAFGFFQEGLRLESNELVLRLISRQINNIYWTYFTDEQRIQYQLPLEKMLFSRLQQNEKSNIKKILFQSYRSIAHTGIGLDRLYRIWNKDLIIPNLSLNKDNYTSMAMLLAVYEHNDADKILVNARAALSDSSKIERFDFLLPSLSKDSEDRIRFFESFSSKENREKESWVLSACYYIHHPLRQETAIENLEISLTLLEEIQKTGDIFFPKSWLDNTIGMYSSKEAFDILNKFIATHPDLNPQLMLKLLQSTDDLHRTQELFQ
ncbi:MAG: M1 family aminopeptidase [Cyclobacteriaceae bacterium]|nr:M1 family aminopeptidase [Cyclobacteriaceae bacterium]